MRKPPVVINRKAELPSGYVFQFGGRQLMVIKAHGTDKAAPVIVEELRSSAVALKGQLSLWSLDGITRRGRRAFQIPD